MFKKLARSIREYNALSILTPILIVGEVVMECLMPFVMANMVNDISEGAGLDVIIRYGVILIVMALASLCFGGLAGATCAKASAGFAKNLRHDMYHSIQRFSFGNIDRFSSASLVTRMTTDVGNVQMAFMMLIRTAIRCPLMLVFAAVMAFVMGGKLALIFIVVIPILAGGLILVAFKALPMFRRIFKKYDKMNESIEENVRAMCIVKAFVREGYETEKFKKASEDVRKNFTTAERIVALNSPLMQICLYANMVGVLLVGSYLIFNPDLSSVTINVGQLSSMLVYGFQILISLLMLSLVFVIITMSIESARRISEVLDEEPLLKNCDDPVQEIPDGSVRFEDVSFKYSAEAAEYALENINLDIKSGQTIGILGMTGSSKTTLIQLISRLYDVTEGRVLVGGRDVREYDLTKLRDSVGVVLQKNMLFSGTIRENLRWGNPDATDEELEEVCRLAQADDFIRAFPDGYDTWIEQGGTNVSGGQKQRICIARALLKHPKILILDDSTSAVDTRTDAMISKGMREFMPQTTKIIIAQRVASVEEADQIVMMKDGHIQAIGSHNELMQSEPDYRSIYISQNQAALTEGGDLHA